MEGANWLSVDGARLARQRPPIGRESEEYRETVDGAR
jgi:hypothetical protein